MSELGLDVLIEPEEQALRERYEALVRREYQRCHPDDTFDALKHRARFSKEAQGLVRDWMAAAKLLAGKG
jgi:hypothetical protein